MYFKKYLIKSKKIIDNNEFKKFTVIFISLFSFLSAIGIFFSIYNTADSNPKLVWLFLSLGLVSFIILSFVILTEIIRLSINYRKKQAGSKLQTKIIIARK